MTASLSEPAAKKAEKEKKNPDDAPKKKKKSKAAKKAKPSPRPRGRPKTKTKTKVDVSLKAPLEVRLQNSKLKEMKIRASELPPQRPRTAYTIFVSERYAQGIPKPFTRENFHALTLEIASAWRALSDAEKEVYLEKAKQARAEFEKARDEWHTKADPRLLRAVNIQRRAKNMPTVHAYGVRRPLSPYIKFFIAVQKDIATDPSSDKNRMIQVTTKVSEMWNKMSEEEKAPYKLGYIEEVEVWKKTKQDAA